MTTETDSHYMHLALRLAGGALGQTWPNPAVGAILVKNNQHLAQGVTARSGRPHAETLALASLAATGGDAQGATLYVTMEPCAHHGETPPCVDAIIRAGIARVVVACLDPDPRTHRKGITLLQQAGIEVTTGVLEAEAQELNSGFFCRTQHGRPHITLKLATSLDGKIALAHGQSRWITNEASRQRVHEMRASMDAILTTAATVTADDPLLTCRLNEHNSEPPAHQPLRMVWDRNLRISTQSKLVQMAAQYPLWVLCNTNLPDASASAKQALHAHHVQLHPTEMTISNVLQYLGSHGLTRVMVEAGGTFAAALLAADKVDAICWFRAPIIIGGDGMDVFSNLELTQLSQASRWKCNHHETLDGDTLEHWRRC